jgi:cytochrome c-type biogenesis protein CcmH
MAEVNVKRVKCLEWCVVGLLLVTPAAASAAPQPVASQPSADAAAKAASLEREARQIETMLIAPCCWREQVSVHQSEAAQQVKQEIRTMLGAGMVRQQVLDAFVERYGVRILAEPPDEGFGRVLYHAPWIVGLGSAAGLVLLIRRITRRPGPDGPAGARGQPDGAAPTSPPERETAIEESYTRRLDDELRNLD